MALNPQDQFFEFVHKRMGFLDAEDRNPPHSKKKSETGNDCPIIYDKKGSKADIANYKEHQLSQTGGFILTFVLQWVARDLIAQIYSSEYGVSLPTAQARVDNFIEDLITKNILKKATKHTSTEVPPAITVFDATFTGIRYVFFDVGTNQFFHIRVGYVT
jgi:hypothetical protein